MISHSLLVGMPIEGSATPLPSVEYNKDSASSPINTSSSESHSVVPVLLEGDAKDSLSDSDNVIDSYNHLDKSTASGIY